MRFSGDKSINHRAFCDGFYSIIWRKVADIPGVSKETVLEEIDGRPIIICPFHGWIIPFMPFYPTFKRTKDISDDKDHLNI